MTAATARLAGQGLETDIEEQTTCCFAVQDKVWVSGPDEERWEVYTVLADAEGEDALGGDERCCTAEPLAIGAPSTQSSPSACC